MKCKVKSFFTVPFAVSRLKVVENRIVVYNTFTQQFLTIEKLNAFLIDKIIVFIGASKLVFPFPFARNRKASICFHNSQFPLVFFLYLQSLQIRRNLFFLYYFLLEPSISKIFFKISEKSMKENTSFLILKVCQVQHQWCKIISNF